MSLLFNQDLGLGLPSFGKFVTDINLPFLSVNLPNRATLSGATSSIVTKITSKIQVPTE